MHSFSVLRAEREALSLIHFLREQGQPQSEWLAALSADQTLSEPVRQRALQFALEVGRGRFDRSARVSRLRAGGIRSQLHRVAHSPKTEKHQGWSGAVAPTDSQPA